MENQIGPNQTENEKDMQQKKKPSTALKVTVLVVLIVLLGIGILLPIKLVPNAVSSVASSIASFFIPRENVKLSSTPESVNSGDTFTLKWTGKHRTNGTYSLSYACTTGLRLETSINQSREPITCDTSYYFSPNDNSIDLTVFSEAARYADIKLKLGFLENNATTEDSLGEHSVLVTNANLADSLPPSNAPATSTPVQEPSVVKEPSTPAPRASEPELEEVPTYTAPRTSNPNGLANLEVRPIATGYIGANGAFVESVSVNPTQQAAIKFQVVNVGDKNSGNWTFTADLPSETDPRFDSASQQNLGPGDRIEFVLGFMNLKASTNNVATIVVDPSNYVPESSKANNVARMNIVNSQYYANTGSADLVIRITSVGVVNKNTGTYTSQSTVTSGDRVGIRFEVENIGTRETGNWKFRANLPTSDSANRTFTSETQPSLKAGEKATYTVAFENVEVSGNNTASITVDADSQVSESNENNNSASVTVIRN